MKYVKLVESILNEGMPISDKQKKLIFDITKGKGPGKYTKRDSDDWEGIQSDIKDVLNDKKLSEKEISNIVDMVNNEKGK